MKKQTAIEIFFNDLVANGYFKKLPITEYKQAKQMEREQIVNSYCDGRLSVINNEIIHFEQYYEETYGTT